MRILLVAMLSLAAAAAQDTRCDVTAARSALPRRMLSLAAAAAQDTQQSPKPPLPPTALAQADQPAREEAAEPLKVRFRPLFARFGECSTTKVKVVSGPKTVEMRNGKVAGKQWIARSGRFRFKLTIQDETGVELDHLVKLLEKLPAPYMRACTVVSDEGEDGIAIYAELGGARGHGGQRYINITPAADALVVAHEAGHALEQVARDADPKILDKWEEAIKADNISVSDYGDNVRHEDLAEFAQVYAVCLGAGPEHLALLKKLSPARFALWESILVGRCTSTGPGGPHGAR